MAMTIAQLEAELAKLKSGSYVRSPSSARVRHSKAIGDFILTQVGIPIALYEKLKRKYETTPQASLPRCSEDKKAHPFALFVGQHLKEEV